MPFPDVEIPVWAGWLIIAGAVIGALRVMTRTRVISWLTAAILEAITEAVREVVREETSPIRDELRTNGGLSLRDAVDRIERKQTAFEEKHVAHEQWSVRERQRILERLDRLDEAG